MSGRGCIASFQVRVRGRRRKTEQALESEGARRAAHRRMAGQHCLLHHSSVLADDSPIRGTMASQRRLAVSGSCAGMVRNLARLRCDYRPLAARRALCHALELVARGIPSRGGHLNLCSRWSAFQLVADRGPAGDFIRESFAAVGNDGHSIPRAASHLSGAFVRVAGVERGDGAGRVLGADGFRDCHWSSDDSHGGCGVGGEIWGGVSEVSIGCTRAPASNLVWPL